MKRSLFAIALATLLGALVIEYWQTEPPAAPPVPTPIVQAPVPAADAPPAIQHPVAPPPATAHPLPELDDSDQALGAELAQLMGVQALPGFFYPDRMIRRLVATVDNLPRRRLAMQLMPLRPVPGSFTVTAAPERIAPANAVRYRLYVEALEAVDPAALVEVYARFYPLFQQAYVELGYPHGYFNDRLIEVLDMLLAAPDQASAAKLVRPSVMYKFSDAGLEALSAGEKILLRMGEDNARRVKASLHAIRDELLRRVP
ncbi:MAG: DUF3014 domain-containing protein [Thiohalomonadaceae bacterium]